MPITDYARCKVRCEEALSKLAGGGFSPVCLRLAHAYGISPRLRLDTVVNEFTASAVALGQIQAKTAGRAWRPLLHVEDIARAFSAILMAPDECVSREIVNVVGTEENYRIIDVADAVTELILNSTYTMNRELPDRRSYRVSGEKLRRVCPRLTQRWTLRDGIRQLRDALENAGLSPGEFRSSRYRRLAQLAALRQRGELSASLQRTARSLASIA